MENLTPISAVLGGSLIGAAAALFLLLNGRIAGISGILSGLVQPASSEIDWRMAFLAGLLLAPLVYVAFAGTLLPVVVEASLPQLVVAGLLVGFGSRLEAGCTSGHGVCGIGRGSSRSVAATSVFITTAVATVLITRHFIGV